MADKLNLDVVTPVRLLLSESVDSVTVPGASGELGILPGHTPLISLLKTGVLSYTMGSTTRKLMVSGGFFEVTDGHVSVLAELAETSAEIDVAAAKSARETAERSLAAASSDPAAYEAAQLDFDRANTRIQLAASAE
jgi:F-type H+-transporting ATPase subunit epsilon